jgi:hypothetical protein
MDYGTLPVLRDISLLLLCFEAFIIMLVPGAAAYFTVRGLRYLQREVPMWLAWVRDKVLLVNRVTHTGADRVAAPFIWVESRAHGVREGAGAVRRAFWR